MVLVTPSPDGDQVTPDGTKKKRLTTTLEKSDGRRLVEYLVVVSSLPREPPAAAPSGDNNGAGGLQQQQEQHQKQQQQEQWNLSTSFDDEDIEVLRGFTPSITARYPLYEHEDNPLHENVTFFCHPSGAIQLKKEPFMPKVRRRTPWRRK